uniref:CLIP domain-containing serine protease n=2 Tax=Anopheles triannulatus TaxID=58253 RepID=A0A2M4AL94_9DIPT
MRIVWFTVVSLFSAQWYGGAVAQSSCRTPDHRDGVCIPVPDCKSIQDNYFSSDRVLSGDEVDFLNQLRCQGTPTVTICCPDNVVTLNRTVTAPASGELPSLKKFECGLESLTDRIVGGSETSLDEFPWYALLEYESKKGVREFKCGGSLINQRYVLTAAHCLANRKLDDGERLVSVRLGEHNTATEVDCNPDFCADPVQDFGFERLIVHELYEKNGKTQHHDIALIRLDRDVTMGTYVSPVCLPPEDFVPSDSTSNITVVGFGHTGRRKHSGVKLKASFPVFDQQECDTKWSTVPIIPQQLCAGGIFGIDSCTGDSGGPLMTQRLFWVQEGIVSFGNNCALEGWPGIYTRVSAYMDWIRQQIRAG